ncbi:chaperonin 10-like protein [Ilyonectria sp. MPI-CAGE-AT-0026]|nr:chaperonin 10-like protein [Ilyonectria sp. MPI-CAGE-AT-0026]
MAIPDTYSAFRRSTGDFPRTIELSSETLPKDLGLKDVLLKIHAVSLNYRDVAMLQEGKYPATAIESGIPASDAAGEVVAIGKDVKDFKIGDRVSPIFDVGNITGREDIPPTGLGGDSHGVLREYGVFEERHLVKLPQHLSWEEASLLSCAGVTAWTALGGLPQGTRTAFFQGTGGVSMFGMQLCLAAGIQPIITSSDDKKIQYIESLSPKVRGINYKTHPDQSADVLRLTDGKGVDFVVNNTGVGSIPTDIGLLRQRGGTVSLVGFLDGFQADWSPDALFLLMSKTAQLRGIGVGSREDYVRLNRFLEQKKVSLTPIISRVFPFRESKAAFDYLSSGKHIGKVVIKM